MLYSLAGRWHKRLTWIFLGALVALGIRYWHGWLVWAALLYFLGRRHPAIIDPGSIGPARKKLAWLTLAIFLLCFTPAPLVENPGEEGFRMVGQAVSPAIFDSRGATGRRNCLPHHPKSFS